jgi:hypothetical protein
MTHAPLVEASSNSPDHVVTGHARWFVDHYEAVRDGGLSCHAE